MASSATLLSLATCLALVGIVLAAAAFGTDHWRRYDVDRGRLVFAMSRNATLRRRLSSAMNRTSVYFGRSYGLFRECYMTQVPVDRGTFRTALGANCVTRRDDYQLPVDDRRTKDWTSEQWARTNLLRATVALYAAALALLSVTLLTGLCGCWRRSANMIMATGFLLLAASLLQGASMATWHGADYLSRDVIAVWPYELSWDMSLVDVTSVAFGYSYVTAWVGCGCVHVAALLALVAYRAMKEEELDAMEQHAAPYYTPAHYDKNALVPYSGPGARYNAAVVPYYGPGASPIMYYGMGYYAANGASSDVALVPY